MVKFNIEENPSYISFREAMEDENAEDEKRLQPSDELLEQVKKAA
jgi:hypothetical protein